MTMKNYFKYPVLSLTMMLAFSGCPRNGGGTPHDEKYYNNQGWTLFTEHNYPDALTAFSSTLDINFNNIEGNVGKGWTLIMLDNSSFSSASSYLNKGKYDATWGLVAKTGLAVMTYTQKDYKSSNTYINEILSVDSSFVFEQDTSINYLDLLLFQANIHFLDQDYSGCWSIIQKMTSDYILDPDNPKSWIIADTTYPTFPAVLTEILYLLSQDYSAP